MSIMSSRVQPFGTTVFTEMNVFARDFDVFNLGQGFPNFAAPDFVKQAVKDAMDADINQYPPPNGLPRLRQAIAAQLKSDYDLDVNPDTEVCAMHGATECIFATIMSLVDPGDEVILFEPYYDSYVPSTLFAGGVPKYYTLRAPSWDIDFDELEKLFNDKTKLIMINTPHNPTGKVFSTDELQKLADLCLKYDVIAVTDEVYEQILYDGVVHKPLITFDGMRDRTVRISSIGKTFSVTGWKVGWIVGAPALVNAGFRSHQWVTFAGASPLEYAAAVALESAETHNYYNELRATYAAKRILLETALTNAGLKTLPTQGAYYSMVDISDLPYKSDRDFCFSLIESVGVVAIPPSAFYSNPADGHGIARFAFCKTDETIAAAGERLLKL